MRSHHVSYTVLALAGAVALVASACGSANDSSLFPNGGDAGPDGGIFAGENNADGNFSTDLDASQGTDAIYANDPPPQWCGPADAGFTPPPPPTGSASCPSDKNLQGCPCTKAGETAACWPGLRRNRGVGICKDGQATCQQSGEFGLTWGPCQGAVLPQPNGPTAADKCECFSQGQWHIENLDPYFVTYTPAGGGHTTYGISTYQDPATGASTNPTFPPNPPPPVPTVQWSKDDLTVDCAGQFVLCYELKAGDFNHPQPTDCSVAKVCLPSTFYPTANTKMEFPPLPGWLADASHSACSDSFHNNGGYGEMTVKGQTVMCDAIDDGSGNPFVFHRIQYCPASNTNCGQDGTGVFN